MLEITEKQASDIIILQLKGKITIGSGDVALRRAVEETLEKGNRKLLLNMARVSYIDSSGTGELVACFTRYRKAGGQLKLLNISQKIQDILQIAQLFSVFEVFTDEAKAVASFTES